ncbi:MAG: UDP-N-acetylglucosamine 1-carboxyvinyltransferase [Endomicrobia bacterium]|nr:UDP-N-acetylglucosamine 1-carboxyvinyltransferase [Endomicrobiia bacterium]MCX7940563.1 UDP-N-acetylglucosamine 1-carboxyvinyltransferase [Endomicrobiia bacterium]MDW8056048.1 UDP-N-acetylglucosamine 1-carboxyvinyltransferase [Elusimicrobiota bacterium]
MEKYVIEGGSQLKGEVIISGSKNAALPIIIASLLTDNEVVLYNVPFLKDIQTTISIIEYLGKKVYWVDHSCIKIISNREPYKEKGYVIAPYELIKKMRASFLVSGALLANYNKVKAALPGGCAIGARPVDIHIKAFEQLGVDHYVDGGYEVFIKNKARVKKNVVRFRYPSVGATENIMLFASKIPQEITIVNSATEPEIVDLAEFLKKLGVKIEGAGTNIIRIVGCKKFLSSKIEHKVIPDRIETGTYIIAAGITKGELLLKQTVPQHLSYVIKKLRSSGLKIETEEDKIYIRWVKMLKPQNITTRPYPYFPTDLQAQFMALMSITKGVSKIKETVFENRFLHVSELNRMGANIVVDGNTAIVTGVEKLKGAEVMVSDLRAGAALVLAGLAAEGISKISHIYHLDRGYENLADKLTSLGAKIKRIQED